MPENTNKVIQLQDNEGNDVSPVVNVGSIYDKNGQKIDNLLSYVVAGTDVPIPEVGDITNDLQDQVDQMVSTATSQIDAKLDAVDEALSGIDTAVDDKLSSGGLPINDVRTYPVREGEVIHAGDVVNVGKGVVSGTTYGDLAVGSIVQINENGSPVDYIVVHQGNPNTGIYDASCDGTWLLRKNVLPTSISYQDAESSCQYAYSDIAVFLESSFIPTLDNATSNIIKKVKIPYASYSSNPSQTGSNGFECKAFILGTRELGWGSVGNQDGAKLSYFSSGTGSAANEKRRASSNAGSGNVAYWTRTPSHGSLYVYYVTSTGGNESSTGLLESHYIRPCIIVDPDAISSDSVVYGNETAYHDIIQQDNVETVIHKYPVTKIALSPLNDTKCLLLTSSNSTAYTGIALIDLGDNFSSLKWQVATVESAGGVCLARLDDNRAIVGRIRYSISSDSGGNAFLRVCTASGNSVSLGTEVQVESSTGGTLDRGIYAMDIVPLDNDRVFVATCENSSGGNYTLLGLVYSISNDTLTRVSEERYSPMNYVRTPYISASKLSKNADGSDRICVCFTCGNDNDKGAAVVATVNTSGTISFGQSTVFETSAISGSGAAIDTIENGDDVIVAYTIANGLRVKVLSIDGTTITSNSHADVKTVTTNNIAIASNGESIILLYNDGNGKAVSLTRDGTTLTASNELQFNSSTTRAISTFYKGGHGFITAYSDDSNSQYSTITTLNVIGGKVCGSISDTSSDAIALSDGTGGQNIQLGFSGVCSCPDILKGALITSPGVTGYGVSDGWLQIKNAWERGFVYGHVTKYMDTLINIGFRPTFVLIAGGGPVVMYSDSMRSAGFTSGGSSSSQFTTTYTPNESGFTIHLGQLSPDTFDYIAFR